MTAAKRRRIAGMASPARVKCLCRLASNDCEVQRFLSACALTALVVVLSSRAAEALPCRLSILDVEHVTGNTYGFVLGASGSAFDGPATVELYTKSSLYRETLLSAGITMKYAPESRYAMSDDSRLSPRHRSKPYYVTFPADGSMDAAVLLHQPEETEPCDAGRFVLSAAGARRSEAKRDRSVERIGEEIRRGASEPSVSPGEAEPLPPVDCKEPYRDAEAVHIVTPNTPLTARWDVASGTSVIVVQLSESGAVLSAMVFRSSGRTDLDWAALGASRSSTYRPEVFRCVPIAGSYTFRADFESW
jgi:hypothetical protein